MKFTAVNSPTAPQPAGGYSQAIEVVGTERLLFVSGQIPQSVAGEVPVYFPAQARLAWRNVSAQLEAAGMSLGNLVKVTMFLSSREFALANREIRRNTAEWNYLGRGIFWLPPLGPDEESRILRSQKYQYRSSDQGICETPVPA